MGDGKKNKRKEKRSTKKAAKIKRSKQAAIANSKRALSEAETTSSSELYWMLQNLETAAITNSGYHVRVCCDRREKLLTDPLNYCPEHNGWAKTCYNVESNSRAMQTTPEGTPIKKRKVKRKRRDSFAEEAAIACGSGAREMIRQMRSTLCTARWKEIEDLPSRLILEGGVFNTERALRRCSPWRAVPGVTQLPTRPHDAPMRPPPMPAPRTFCACDEMTRAEAIAAWTRRGEDAERRMDDLASTMHTLLAVKHPSQLNEKQYELIRLLKMFFTQSEGADENEDENTTTSEDDESIVEMILPQLPSASVDAASDASDLLEIALFRREDKCLPDRLILQAELVQARYIKMHLKQHCYTCLYGQAFAFVPSFCSLLHKLDVACQTETSLSAEEEEDACRMQASPSVSPLPLSAAAFTILDAAFRRQSLSESASKLIFIDDDIAVVSERFSWRRRRNIPTPALPPDLEMNKSDQLVLDDDATDYRALVTESLSCSPSLKTMADSNGVGTDSGPNASCSSKATASVSVTNGHLNGSAAGKKGSKGKGRKTSKRKHAPPAILESVSSSPRPENGECQSQQAPTSSSTAEQKKCTLSDMVEHTLAVMRAALEAAEIGDRGLAGLIDQIQMLADRVVLDLVDADDENELPTTNGFDEQTTETTNGVLHFAHNATEEAIALIYTAVERLQFLLLSLNERDDPTLNCSASREEVRCIIERLAEILIQPAKPHAVKSAPSSCIEEKQSEMNREVLHDNRVVEECTKNAVEDEEAGPSQATRTCDTTQLTLLPVVAVLRDERRNPLADCFVEMTTNYYLERRRCPFLKEEEADVARVCLLLRRSWLFESPEYEHLLRRISALAFSSRHPPLSEDQWPRELRGAQVPKDPILTHGPVTVRTAKSSLRISSNDWRIVDFAQLTECIGRLPLCVLRLLPEELAEHFPVENQRELCQLTIDADMQSMRQLCYFFSTEAAQLLLLIAEKIRRDYAARLIVRTAFEVNAGTPKAEMVDRAAVAVMSTREGPGRLLAGDTTVLDDVKVFLRHSLRNPCSSNGQ